MAPMSPRSRYLLSSKICRFRIFQTNVLNSMLYYIFFNQQKFALRHTHTHTRKHIIHTTFLHNILLFFYYLFIISILFQLSRKENQLFIVPYPVLCCIFTPPEKLAIIYIGSLRLLYTVPDDDCAMYLLL